MVKLTPAEFKKWQQELHGLGMAKGMLATMAALDGLSEDSTYDLPEASWQALIELLKITTNNMQIIADKKLVLDKELEDR